MDWIGLITLLINCLIKAEIHDQASYYAQNLIAYIGKAQREGLIPTYLAVMVVLGLESLYVTPLSDLIAKARQFKLPELLVDCLQLYFMSPLNQDHPEVGLLASQTQGDLSKSQILNFDPVQNCSFMV